MSAGSGAAEQFLIVEDPSPFSGLYVHPQSGSTSGWGANPIALTTSAFTVSDGEMRLSVNLAMLAEIDPNSQFNFGLKLADDDVPAGFRGSYRVRIRAGDVTLYRWPESGNQGVIGGTQSWTFTPGAFHEVTLVLAPTSASASSLKVLVDGTTVVSTSNSLVGVPILNSEVVAFFSANSNFNGYLSSVTLTSIPEPGSLSLLGGAVLLGAAYRLRRRPIG